MNRLSFTVLGCLLACFAVFATGCGSGVPMIETEYVEGIVTLDGSPVADATVMFVPVTQGQGMSANGTTDANGVYKLTAVAVGADKKAPVEGGTLPGEYRVAVIKTKAEVPMSREEAEEKGLEFKESAGNEEAKLTYLVPQKYNNPRDSEIVVTVSEGKNDIPIKLTSK